MGDGVIQLPRYFVRTVLIVSTWVAGAAFAAYVPDQGAQPCAEELVSPVLDPGALPGTAPAKNPHRRSHAHPATHSGRPSEAPPLINPPSPAPA
ncbi:MAG: hypothetical protein ABI461_19810 [Polyangiaceae bacterium]